jgi:hypothetical protein
MKRGMIFRWPRWTRILAALALVAFAILAIRPLREPVLRAAGWALVIKNEPVAPADVIVLSIDSGGAGALEAADLVQSGVSKRVAVFQDPPSGEDHEFIRRGLPYEDAGARQIRQLRMLGVTDVTQISRIDGTESEGQMLPQWADQRHLRSIAVVAGKDHSRRLRRVLDRDMKGHSHMSRFEPRATQALTRIDGGKLAAASGQKSSNSRNSCSTLCCTQCHFDSREEAARVTDGGSSTTGVARRANATFGLS